MSAVAAAPVAPAAAPLAAKPAVAAASSSAAGSASAVPRMSEAEIRLLQAEYAKGETKEYLKGVSKSKATTLFCLSEREVEGLDLSTESGKRKMYPWRMLVDAVCARRPCDAAAAAAAAVNSRTHVPFEILFEVGTLAPCGHDATPVWCYLSGGRKVPVCSRFYRRT